MFILIHIFFSSKKEKEEKAYKFHKEENGLFLLYPVLISFLVSLLVFSKLGSCGRDTVDGKVGQSCLKDTPHRTWRWQLPRPVCGGVFVSA